MIKERSSAHGSLVLKLEGFSPLQDADRAALAAIEEGGRHVPGGTDLIREGDRSDGMLMVTEGFACRYKLRETGARKSRLTSFRAMSATSTPRPPAG